MSEVFVVFPPLANNSLIYGRNSFSFCCKEILLFSPNSSTKVSFVGLDVSESIACSPTQLSYLYLLLIYLDFDQQTVKL